MRNRGFKLILLVLAAAGGVVAWQRRNETPAVAPYPRPADPFMDPAAPRPVPAPTDAPLMQAPEAPADDLKCISGIGPKLEQLLNEQGVTTYAQLAALSDGQVDELQARLTGFPGRIRRDDWIGQATRLMQE